MKTKKGQKRTWKMSDENVKLGPEAARLLRLAMEIGRCATELAAFGGEQVGDEADEIDKLVAPLQQVYGKLFEIAGRVQLGIDGFLVDDDEPRERGRVQKNTEKPPNYSK